MKNLFILLIMLLSSVLYAELITNGDFENSTTGWSWYNVDGAGGRTTMGNPVYGFIINDAGAAGSDPTLYQNIAGLTIGAEYTISGDYRIAHGSYRSDYYAFGVAIDNNLWQYYLNFSGWRSFSETFTATSENLTLVLTGERNGTDTDPMVDNISLVKNELPIPEPGSILLLICGIFYFFKIVKK